MQDLTAGSVNRHLLKVTSFMLVMMVFQTPHDEVCSMFDQAQVPEPAVPA